MITLPDMREWSDSPVGTLVTPLPSSKREAEVEIAFSDDVRPFRTAPFVFVIGGLIENADGTTKDTREVVFCNEVIEVEPTSRGVYRVQRDPANSGVVPPAHTPNEPVYQNNSGGTVVSHDLQFKYLTEVLGHIAYLEDLLLVLFGTDTSIVPNLWPDYDNLAVTPTNPPSTDVKINPGGLFIRPEGEEVSRMLVVAPGTRIYGKSLVSLVYPEEGTKQWAVVYIDVNGNVLVSYGEPTTRPENEPAPVDVGSITDVYQALAAIYLDSVSGERVVNSENIFDNRPWSEGG